MFGCNERTAPTLFLLVREETNSIPPFVYGKDNKKSRNKHFNRQKTHRLFVFCSFSNQHDYNMMKKDTPVADFHSYQPNTFETHGRKIDLQFFAISHIFITFASL